MMSRMVFICLAAPASVGAMLRNPGPGHVQDPGVIDWGSVPSKLFEDYFKAPLRRFGEAVSNHFDGRESYQWLPYFSPKYNTTSGLGSASGAPAEWRSSKDTTHARPTLRRPSGTGANSNDSVHAQESRDHVWASSNDRRRNDTPFERPAPFTNPFGSDGRRTDLPSTSPFGRPGSNGAMRRRAQDDQREAPGQSLADRIARFARLQSPPRNQTAFNPNGSFDGSWSKRSDSSDSSDGLGDNM